MTSTLHVTRDHNGTPCYSLGEGPSDHRNIAVIDFECSDSGEWTMVACEATARGVRFAYTPQPAYRNKTVDLTEATIRFLELIDVPSRPSTTQHVAA